MVDRTHTTDQAKPAASDTTGGAAPAAGPGADKGAGPSASNPGADSSSTLLDGTLDPSYLKMIQANQAAAAGGGGKPAAATTSRDLQQKGILSHLTVTYHATVAAASPAGSPEASPEAGRENPAVADGTQPVPVSDKQQRLAYVQATVQNFLPVVMAPEKGVPDAALQATIAQRQNAIKEEAAWGEFGPETRAAYGQYVDWLEKKALPSTFHDLQIFKLAADEPGSKGPKAPSLDLKINKNEVPDEQELERLDGAVKWAQSADARVQVVETGLLNKIDSDFQSTVTRMNLPSGWIQDMDRDHQQWRSSVGTLINGALTARSNIEILDELNKGGGSTPVASILPPNMGVQRDATGKIKSIHLDLPQGWDLSQPDNKRRAEGLDAMLAETNALIAPTVPQLRTIASHPERAINWGDTEVSGMKGKFDSQGNFLGLIGKDDQAPDGVHTEDVNLVESRFSVEKKDNKIVIHQQVQAQSVPWWGYQNLIGVKNVGNQIDITHTYNPTDNVVVRTDTGYVVKQAQDLGTYRNWQMAKHYGEKTLMGALDAGMLVSGTIEVGAAVKAARLAGVGVAGLDFLGRGAAERLMTSEGVEVSSRMLALQAGKGLMRTTVGLTGLLNNAGARESSLGQTVNTARSLYFLGDATLGLGTGGVKLARSVFGLGDGAAGAAGAGKLTLAGLTAGSRAENFYHLTHGVFKVSEFGFMPLIADDLTKGIQKAHNDQNKHVIRAAEIVASDEAKPQGAP